MGSTGPRRHTKHPGPRRRRGPSTTAPVSRFDSPQFGSMASSVPFSSTASSTAAPVFGSTAAPVFGATAAPAAPWLSSTTAPAPASLAPPLCHQQNIASLVYGQHGSPRQEAALPPFGTRQRFSPPQPDSPEAIVEPSPSQGPRTHQSWPDRQSPPQGRRVQAPRHSLARPSDTTTFLSATAKQP